MKQRLLKRYGNTTSALLTAEALLTNDQTQEFSNALDVALEDLTRIQDDLAVYAELVGLRALNAELTEANTALTDELATFKTESD